MSRMNLVATQTDSLDIMQIIKRGDIDFSKSQVKNDPCRNYWIEGAVDQKDLVITVELCDSTAVVKTLVEKQMVKNKCRYPKVSTFIHKLTTYF